MFRFKKKEYETLAEYCTGTARVARTIWTKMKLPILYEVIESTLRAMVWVCDPKAKCGHQYFETCIQEEKHEVVANYKRN